MSKTDRIEERVKIRLDKALANNAWQLIFHGAIVHHISMSTLDHSLRLKNNSRQRQPAKKLFRFEEMWLRDPRYSEVVQESWHEVTDLEQDGEWPCEAKNRLTAKQTTIVGATTQ